MLVHKFLCSNFKYLAFQTNTNNIFKLHKTNSSIQAFNKWRETNLLYLNCISRSFSLRIKKHERLESLKQMSFIYQTNSVLFQQKRNEHKYFKRYATSSKKLQTTDRRIYENSGKTTSEIGLEFEKRIESLLIRLGKFPVRHNTPLRDRYGNLSQIDLKYGWLRPRYVECKCYSLHNKVPLEDVAKFAYVLEGNGISKRRGLFVTSSHYKSRSFTVGIECWDIEQIEKLEKQVHIRLLFRILFTISLYILSIIIVITYWDSILERVKQNESIVVEILESPQSIWNRIKNLFSKQDNNQNKISNLKNQNDARERDLDTLNKLYLLNYYLLLIYSALQPLKIILVPYFGYTPKEEELWLNRFKSKKEIEELSFFKKVLLFSEVVFSIQFPESIWQLDL